MRHLLIAAAAVTLSSSAMAEDVGAFDWTGFYAGANGGYASGSSRNDPMPKVGITPVASDSQDAGRFENLNLRGGFGGVQTGYNWQYGNFVLGLEADLQGGSISGRAVDVDPQETRLTTRSRINWFGTVRPRVGYAFDNVLIYATGGLAVGGVKQSQTATFGISPAMEDYSANPGDGKINAGFAVGGGVEYAINRHWSAKVEYQHIDLGRSNISADAGGISGGAGVAPAEHSTLGGSSHIRFNTLRLGVNYRF